MGMLWNWDMLMVSQLHKSTKHHQTVHLQWMDFMVCRLDLNKTVFLKEVRTFLLLHEHYTFITILRTKVTRRLHYLKRHRKDRELSVISSKGQGRSSPTEKCNYSSEWGERENRAEVIFEELIVENFPKPTEDSWPATNSRIHLRKTSENQRQKENPLKRSQRYKFKKRQN